MSKDYVYMWEGERHTKTDTAHLKSLGMSDDDIKSLQYQANK